MKRMHSPRDSAPGREGRCYHPAMPTLFPALSMNNEATAPGQVYVRPGRGKAKSAHLFRPGRRPR